jgi:hypothetical protein
LPWPTIGICVSSADLLSDFFISSVPPVAALDDDATVAALSASVADGTDGAAVPSALAPANDDTGAASFFADSRVVFDDPEQAAIVATEMMAVSVKKIVGIFILIYLQKVDWIKNILMCVNST